MPYVAPVVAAVFVWSTMLSPQFGIVNHWGQRLLGWDDEIGSLEAGKLADVALWRVDTAAHAGIADPVAALVLGTPPPLELLLVQGRPVVRCDALVDVDEERLAVDVRAASETLVGRAVGS